MDENTVQETVSTTSEKSVKTIRTKVLISAVLIALEGVALGLTLAEGIIFWCSKNSSKQ